MKLRILKASVVDDLKRQITENIPIYKSGSFCSIIDDSSYIEIDVEFDPKPIEDLHKVLDEGNNSQADIDASIKVFSSLSNLKPFLARDERLWAYLTHTIGLNYSRSRWPIDDSKDQQRTAQFIRRHFFASGARQVERDNAISRLWWMAYLCSRHSSLNLREALSSLLYRADVRANILERPTTAQSRNVFDLVLEELHNSFNKSRSLYDRAVFRKKMTKLNLLGGTVILDVLSNEEIKDRIF